MHISRYWIYTWPQTLPYQAHITAIMINYSHEQRICFSVQTKSDMNKTGMSEAADKKH